MKDRNDKSDEVMRVTSSEGGLLMTGGERDFLEISTDCTRKKRRPSKFFLIIHVSY